VDRGKWHDTADGQWRTHRPGPRGGCNDNDVIEVAGVKMGFFTELRMGFRTTRYQTIVTPTRWVTPHRSS
jgi:hypothetical protein